MIFPSDQAGYLERGERTTIRVPVDHRLTATPLRPVRKGHARPFLPTTGGLLDIQHPIQRPQPDGTTKEGRETRCHVTITNVHRGPLGHLTDDQAIAEGFPTPDEFQWAWMQRHDRDYIKRNLGYLAEQGTDPDDAIEAIRLMAMNRYPDRWAAREVWTLTVQVEHDLDRVMERAATAKSELGYTIGQDQIDGGVIPPLHQLAARWPRRAARRHLEAIRDNATPEERSRRARALGRRVRELALQDPKLMSEIERLVRDAEQEAA